MKKIYSLLLFSLSFVSFGQFYSENMGVPNGTTTISAYVTGTPPATFQVSAPVAYSGTADVRTSTPSSGYIGSSGGGNVFINAVDEFFQIDNLNTSAYNTADLQLSFGINTPTAVTNVLVIEISIDNGTTWTPITYTPSGTGWTLATIAGGVIPSNADLAIRFKSTSALQYRIDDVKLSSVSATCTLVLQTPTVACAANTSGTDTYTVTIPYTGAGNGNYTITPSVGTVGGDNPTTTAAGNILITGISEGVPYSATITGVTCNFTVNGFSPECDGINPLPFIETFNGTVASGLGASPFWTNIGTGDEIVYGTGNLSYPGITPSGNHVTFAGAGLDSIAPLTPTTSGTLYYSYLLNVDSMAGVTDVNGGYISAFSNGATTFSGSLWTKRIDDTTYNIGLEVRTANATSTTFATNVLQTGTTYFVVVGYTIGDSSVTSDDTASLWINPIVGAAQPAATITDAHTTGTDMSQITGILLRQDSNTETPSLKIDELRVGSTWTDVTGVLSVEENEIAGLTMYPNPANDVLYITTELNDVKNIAIYDIVGKQVVNTTTSSSEINVSNLNSGIYIVKIIENGLTATRKLVIR